ncbi:hypothetical protein F5884DRAFT_780707 [Xylogone sp. PMI_703]|nr:hypothetical protein F5884DRAFT_780707 [Xylogone sp. PMI_703]
MCYCDPSLSASVCSGCPSTTTSGDPSCQTGFNMILLLPPAAIAGVFIPPPPGLPTLTIGTDGAPTPTTAKPTTPPSPSTSTTSSQSSESIVAACTIPPNKAADLAASVEPSPTWIPPVGTPAPSVPPDALPILPITVNPAQPTAWIGCGSGTGNPYFPEGFYQYSDTFSRNDGLNVIDRFCEEKIASKELIGPPGETISSSPKKAIPTDVKTYTTPGGSGKLTIMINTDVDNKSGISGLNCPDRWAYDFAGGGYVKCRQLFGQVSSLCMVIGD